MLSACNNSSVQPTQPLAPTTSQPVEKHIPVQRYGRYTLVELAPDSAQRNLLLQVVDIDLPSAWSVSVGDALRYVLLRSGYRLCASTPQIEVLFKLPLPAAHMSLGPIVLRDALQTLAGPAWALETNERLRQICFVPADKHSPTKTSASTDATTEAHP
ncbi:PFGI-1 class ICE element type IV pilus protein PilL2 [Pseudomonas sp. LB3P25]|jgi:type IV pili sensor histidine kinase/response regulator